MGWNLHVVPKDPKYRPAPETLRNLMTFLAERFGAPEGYSVDEEDDLVVSEAVVQMARSSETQPRALCRVFLEDEATGDLFGWREDDDDPDANFWADGIRVQITSHPAPFFDYEMGDDALCPFCKKSMLDPIVDRSDDDFSAPLACACGKSFPSADLKFKKRGRAACLSVALIGNRGWRGDYRNPRKAFKDAGFLPALEKTLGTPIEVLAIAT